MKVKLSKTQWEEMGKKAGWLGPEPRPCNCGSGEICEPAYDARGIFLTNICPKCKKKKLSKFRQDVLDNPNYEADEPIEPEASAKRVLKMSFDEKMMPVQTSYTEIENSGKNWEKANWIRTANINIGDQLPIPQSFQKEHGGEYAPITKVYTEEEIRAFVETIRRQYGIQHPGYTPFEVKRIMDSGGMVDVKIYNRTPMPVEVGKHGGIEGIKVNSGLAQG